MEWGHRHQTQTIFGILQSVVILGGCFLTKIMLTARGIDLATAHLPFSIWFVINWGFTLIAIPLAWTMGTIWMERHPTSPLSIRWTFFTGLALLIGLGWFSLLFSAKAGSSLIQMQAH